MMDNGKASVGKMLAKELGYYFFDRFLFTFLRIITQKIYILARYTNNLANT